MTKFEMLKRQADLAGTITEIKCEKMKNSRVLDHAGGSLRMAQQISRLCGHGVLHLRIDPETRKMR